MRIPTIKNSEYDQEIPESQTADKPMTPRGRATQSLLDTRKTNQARDVLSDSQSVVLLADRGFSLEQFS